ncbi:sugar ABC transporter ATP-binding protein [Arthrobacter dokdonensis]|uniref:sugar ABC transporter ATP-binding protein n=1 Tax=Arthrobacter dokdonellae TaxID=2211210 RepID=UPI00149403C1|nr:sugar ABC transporter ATP-binding protein [Arthrobacter dokdonellae]
MNSTLLSIENIAKSFPGVRALNDVTFELARGEICTLAGENGAGKSTLLGILGGATAPDHGTVTIDGVRRRHFTPRRALAEGVIIAQQEPAVVPQLTVEHNLLLGRPRSVRRNAKKSIASALEDLEAMGFPLDPGSPVSRLSPAQRHALTIARAFAFDSKIVALDEPTTSMLEHNVEQVLARIREVARERQLGIIYVSHKMPEVMSVSDSVVVLRDGRVAFRSAIAETTEQEIVRKMVGRELLAFQPESSLTENAETLFTATAITNPWGVGPVDISVKAGEVLGIAGLVGSGRTELLRAIVRADHGSTGTVSIGGKRRTIRNPRDSRKAGIAFIPEERKRQGLVLQIPAYLNIAMTAGRQLNTLGLFSSKRKQIEIAKKVTEEMSLRPANVLLNARQFSGGNQQKIVIAKWTWLNAAVYLFDEPTKGVDVGGKVEIYELIDRLAAQGKAVIVVSSDLPEIISLCNRVLVMRSGNVVSSHTGVEINEESLVASAMGITEGKS